MDKNIEQALWAFGYEEQKIFWYESVKKRIGKATEISTKRKDASAERWKSKDCTDAFALHLHCMWITRPLTDL